MLEFITAPENFPFSVALAVMFGIAILEGITTLLGAGLSSLIENLVPGVEIDTDASAAEYQSPSALSKLLSWFRVGEVPVLMLFIVFLTAFGLSGLVIQAGVEGVAGALAPAGLVSIPAFVCALPIVRISGGVLAKVMPKDETDAVSEDSFIGRVAVVTLGKAEVGSPAQAKLRDEHGQTHYVMVEPDEDGVSIDAGASVVLVRRSGAVFKAIANVNAALID